MTSYLVLDLPPRQLAHQELHQHIEERPQVVVAAHLLQGGHLRFHLAILTREDITRQVSWDTDLIFVGVDRRVADGSSKASNWAGLANKE